MNKHIVYGGIVILSGFLLLISLGLMSCGKVEEPEIESSSVEISWEIMNPPEPIPEPETTEESLESLVEKVLRGEYGDGEARKQALGDRYEEVQNYIDENYSAPVYESEEYFEYTPDLINDTSGIYSPQDLMYHGVIYWGGWRFTWYSENVLPGGGLSISGRWSDGNFVRDAYGNICVASSDLPYGTAVMTPWGPGMVYDSGCDSGTIDIYTSW